MTLAGSPSFENEESLPSFSLTKSLNDSPQKPLNPSKASYGSMHSSPSPPQQQPSSPLIPQAHISYKSYVENLEKQILKGRQSQPNKRESDSDTDSLTSHDSSADSSISKSLSKSISKSLSVPALSSSFEEVPIGESGESAGTLSLSYQQYAYGGLIHDDEEALPLLLERENSSRSHHRQQQQQERQQRSLTGPWSERVYESFKQVAVLLASVAIYVSLLIAIYFVMISLFSTA